MNPEKRKYSRRDFSQIIAYSVDPHVDNRFSTGLIHDFSHSGLCVIMLHPLPKGQEIHLKSSIMSNSTTALVRWCGDTGNSTYKVGLELKR